MSVATSACPADPHMTSFFTDDDPLRFCFMAISITHRGRPFQARAHRAGKPPEPLTCRTRTISYFKYDRVVIPKYNLSAVAHKHDFDSVSAFVQEVSGNFHRGAKQSGGETATVPI